ncbi:GLPGLI family protein [Aquirufa salirivi]|uniref:GLPGLI family protein n=1 Tax=Aquirufa salirivi TaxID=3104729 RepID=A0ABW8RY89_9BACT
MKQIGFLLILISFSSFSQEGKKEGMVHYERTTFWANIVTRLTYLSAEEKDRVKLTWGSSDEGWKQKMTLAFNENQSLYMQGEENAEQGWSGRKETFFLTKNFATEHSTDYLDLLGKTYVVDDSLHAPNWKILNQIKEVAGYICMKAVTVDTVKKQTITAWFAQDIPVQAGPERYFGLPGLILELDINDGDVTIIASKIEFKKLTNEFNLKKIKGKKISDAEYNKIIADFIKESIKGLRNPYWGLRY